MGACTTLTQTLGMGVCLVTGSFLCVVIANGRTLYNTLCMHAKCVEIAHGQTHSPTTSSIQTTGTMYVHFCHSLSTKAGCVFTRYNDELMQDFGPKGVGGGGGGCYTVGVYLVLYGANKTPQSIKSDYLLVEINLQYGMKMRGGSRIGVREKCTGDNLWSRCCSKPIRNCRLLIRLWKAHVAHTTCLSCILRYLL